MLAIKAPEAYYCEPGVLARAGELTARYGGRAFIIAGSTARRAAGDRLEAGLRERHIEFDTAVMEGYPTFERVLEYTASSAGVRADFIIGVGGGKVIDVAKGVGNLRGVPVVTVPTVAATCACWAARSVLYTADGDFDRFLWNARNPSLILADTDVLSLSPKRFLAAGILDTVAKWYEFEPLIERDPNDVVLRQDVAIARLALDILEALGPKAMEDAASPEEFRQVLDAIFFLAGATGSFANGKAYRGFAHAYYFASTRVAESRRLLHGEKVAFGLLVQFLLKQKPEDFVRRFIDELKYYRITDTPHDWGAADAGKTVRRIAGLIVKEFPVVVEKGFVSGADDCAEAIDRASLLLRRYR